jgi:hypothetical protein
MRVHAFRRSVGYNKKAVRIAVNQVTDFCGTCTRDFENRLPPNTLAFFPEDPLAA